MGILKVFYIMAFTKKNEEAVSPVIGVILMVAITVILAAVIAAFVFGMAGNITKTKVVAATVQRPDTSNVQVTYNGGQDAATLTMIQWTVNGVNPTTVTGSGALNLSGAMFNGAVGGVVGTYDSTKILPVGASGKIPAAANSHVVAVGSFSDGSNQVLLDTTL